jgi:hypothetical protein
VASKFIPSQNKYFDPYQQRINSGTSGTSGLSPINTAYPQKYLSRVSNQQLLKAIGSSIVMRGIEPTCDYVGPTARVTLSAGALIHDYTFIELSTTNLLDFNVSAYGDTPVSGSHLCVFSNFQYIESPDTDAQTELKLTLYHVDSTGLVVSGSPAFDAARNMLLIAIIDFTKSGSNIISISESTAVSISIMGTIYYPGGSNNANMTTFFDAILGTSGTSGSSGTGATSGTSVGAGVSGTSSVTPGVSGSSGTSGNEIGLFGSSGTSGGVRSGEDGTSGSSGSSGTSGTASGTSGVSGTAGSSGAEIDEDNIIELLFLNNSQL